MSFIISFVVAAVRRFPALVVVAAVGLTGVLGWFAPQMEVSTGNEAFAPDNAEIRALEEVSELFGTEQEAILQIVIRGGEGDVISAEGVRTVIRVEEVVREIAGSRLADTAARPGVVSHLGPVLAVAAEQGLDPALLDDATVDAYYQGALEQMSREEAGLFSSLVGVDGEDATAGSALMLAFFRLDNGDSVAALDAQIELELEIAEALSGIPSDLEIRPFSFNLLFGESQEFTDEVGRLFATAGVIIVVILLFVYWVRGGSPIGGMRRTLADMGLTMVTILMAVAMMQGAGVLLESWGVIQAFSPPTQIVPILIIGLGVDYAIHLTSRYREEVGSGLGVDDAMEGAIRSVGVALTLATVTTVIGFLTNLVNPVPALTDFGILAAIGIFFSFLLMMTFVPALRVLLDRRAERRGRLPTEALAGYSRRLLPQLMGRTAVIAERIPVVALGLALALGGLGFYGFSQLETRFSFTDFLPEDAPSVRTLEILEEEFGGGFGEQTQILIRLEGGELETAEFHNLLADAIATLAGVPHVVTFDGLNGPAAAVSSPLGVIGGIVAAGPDRTPPDVLAAAAAVGLGADLKVVEDADVGRLYEAVRAVAPDRYLSYSHRSGNRVDAILVDVRTTADEDDVGALRTDLARVFAPFADRGAEVVATSQSIIGDVVVQELTASQSASLFVTLLAAGLVLILYFWIQQRRPLLGVLTIAPVVLVVLWTYGLMYATGIPFGPVTATLAALAIGIGVPFTIHMARRFEEDRLEYLDVDEAIRQTATHTGGALAGSALTTIAGFGILMTSSLVPFRQMGQVTAYAIGLALLASLLVLPSLLVMWEKWHRRRASSGGRHLAADRVA